MSQLIAALRAIEERMTAIEHLILERTAPGEAVQQGLDDLLHVYGITAQTGEVVGNQRDQLQALAEGMLHFSNRLIQHDRQSAIERREIQATLLHMIVLASGTSEIAAQAEQARMLLLSDAADARGVVADAADVARERLQGEAKETDTSEAAPHAGDRAPDTS